jgi:hypothetical protein
MEEPGSPNGSDGNRGAIGVQQPKTIVSCFRALGSGTAWLSGTRVRGSISAGNT